MLLLMQKGFQRACPMVKASHPPGAIRLQFSMSSFNFHFSATRREAGMPPSEFAVELVVVALAVVELVELARKFSVVLVVLVESVELVEQMVFIGGVVDVRVALS